MDVEYWIKNCKAESSLLKNYDPDPYYVNYFFRSYLNSVSKAYNDIFEEANRDFGLFITQCTSQKFKEKSILKNDSRAIEFVSWYEEKIKKEHQSYYPAFMHQMITFYECGKELPDIQIMLRAKERHKNDIFQPILVNLRGGMLKSREELQIEVNRQRPIFLKVLNHKRTKCGEPTVSESGIVASAFFEDFEISYAAEIYIQVIERIVADSRKKLGELTRW